MGKRLLRWSAVCFALSIASACSDPNSPIDHPTANVATSSAWQGGTFTVKGLAAADSTPVIFVDSLRAGVIFRGGDSAIVQLPGDSHGTLAVSLGTPGHVVGQIAVAGIVSSTLMPFTPNSEPAPWYVGGVASIVASQITSPSGVPETDRIVRYVLSTGVLEELFPGSAAYSMNYQGARTPVATADPTVFGFSRFTPTGGAIDFFRFPQGVRTDSFAVDFNPVRQVALLSSGVMVRTGPHHAYTRTSPNGTYIYFPTTEGDEDPPEIVLSKDARRAAIPSLGAPFGMAVFGNDGQLMYRVANAKDPYTALFSPGGDTLFVGNDADGRGQLLEVIASTGQVQATIDLGLHIPEGLTLDPTGKWLYVTTVHDDRNPSGPPEYLQILDAKTLEVAGRIPLGISAANCWLKTVVDLQGLYVVCGRQVVKIDRPLTVTPH